MNINIESPSTLRRKLTIDLEPEEIRRELDRAYNELKRTVHLKGFRPGRAPRQLLERFFGDQVRGDVIQKLIRESTEKALAEKALKPVAEPEIITEESDLPKALRFSATFDIKPELVVKDYQALRVPRPRIEVSEAEVDAALERLRERMAPLKKVEGRTTVQAGDFAIVELEGFEEGKPIEGSRIDSRLVEVSDRALRHGLHEVLIGAGVGTPVRKFKSYSAEYEEKDLAGKNVEWRATVKEIFFRALPELDDEFAKDQGECQTLAELRQKIRSSLEAQARQEADARVRQGLLDLVIERNPMEVPESMVAREQQKMEAEIAGTLEAAGMPHQQAAERARQSREELRARAERRARSTLVLDALADQEAVEVGDEELANRVALLVTQAGRDRERVADFYAREEGRAALKQAMRRDKALDLLLERAQVEESAEKESAAGS